MKRVLIIDDEARIRRLLRISLEKKEFEAFEAATGFEGIQAVQGIRPDIILLDLNLPDMDGLAVLAELKKWSSIPVVILSVRNSEEDIVTLLNAGADDYVIKPFNTSELIARMNATLRRTRPVADRTTFTTGKLTIDFDARKIAFGNEEIKLTPTEYGILALLAKSPGKIITQEMILKELWGPISNAELGSLRVHIYSLRKKIEDDPSHPALVITEPGIGYRLAVVKEQN
jgi:two-component system, OmpR family, KDP operon response regulator KdpE